MTSKRNILKPVRPPPPNTGSFKAGITFSGFSFKQLEEDDNGEDLSIFTGSAHKSGEESQKATKKLNEKSPSLTSIGDINQKMEKTELDSVKPAHKSSLSSEATISPLRSAAKARFDSSKELFSGLKGRITDKISRTIEEFSGESSNSSSPDKEKFKTFPLPRSNSIGVIEKEDVHILQSALPAKESIPQGLTKDVTLDLPQNYKPDSLDETDSNSTANDFSNSKPERPHLEEIQSAEDHPLAQTADVEDSFEDVIDDPIDILSPKKSKPVSNDVFKDVQGSDTNIEVFEEYFNNEPVEDFTTFPGLHICTQDKSNSTKNRLIKKKETKTSAVATMSSLHDKCDEEMVNSSHFKSAESKTTKQNEAVAQQSEVKALVPPQRESTSSKVLRQISLDIAVVRYQKLVAFMVVMFAYLIIPLPTYISGLVMGFFMASFGWALYFWIKAPPSAEVPYVPPPDLPLPEMRLSSEIEEFSYNYKGWMNELSDYDPKEYHISKTHSVFVSLEKSHLRLQWPKNSIPKRAMWDEVLPKPQFISQRHYDLPGSSVYLEPPGLVDKRTWSKKYPICISLPSKALTEASKLKHASSDSAVLNKKEHQMEDGFVLVSDENILYLFARTCREKEEWFKRFTAAAMGKPLGNHVLELKRAVTHSSVKKNIDVPRHKREGSTDSVSLSDVQGESVKNDPQTVDLLTFAHYMGRLMPAGSFSPSSSPSHSNKEKESLVKSSSIKELSKSKESGDEVRTVSPSGAIICDNQLYWLNAILGRCFFDFLRDQTWTSKVKDKLEKKLEKIHVPYFIEVFKVTNIHLGYEIPAIKKASMPYLDEKGLWIDLDITYSGGFKMTIETKINLMKLKESSHQSSTSVDSTDYAKSPITHSEEEDSAESSTDEEEENLSTSDDSNSGSGTSKKLLRYLNKITQSKYFHKATEYSVIKRAMENVSNTPLTLTVTLNSLIGTLALNIPPPPSDRLWYGFRKNPHLRLSAKPQVGERAVNIVHITEWIEKKLAVEFQRVFVMPNMDDLIIPILVPGQINGTTISRSVSLS